jgi:hypothetical protein
MSSGALSLRQDCSATVSSFQIIASAFSVFLKRRDASVLKRTALNGDSTDVGGAKVNPMRLRVIKEGHQPVPIPGERRASLGVGSLEAPNELIAFALASRATVRIHRCAQPLCGLRLLFLG